MNPKFLLCLGLTLGLATGCHHESLPEQLARQCRENTNKICPVKVAEDTMLDSMAFDTHSHTLYYYYSLHNYLDSDSLYTPQVVDAHRGTLISELRNSVTLMDAKRARANFSCVYLSASNGRQLMRYDIQANEYADE